MFIMSLDFSNDITQNFVILYLVKPFLTEASYAKGSHWNKRR